MFSAVNQCCFMKICVFGPMYSIESHCFSNWQYGYRYSVIGVTNYKTAITPNIRRTEHSMYILGRIDQNKFDKQDE